MAEPVGGGSNNETIKVTVQGDQAKAGFDAIGAAAKRADQNIDDLGKTIVNIEKALEKMGKVVGWHVKAQLEQAAAAGNVTKKVREKAAALDEAAKKTEDAGKKAENTTSSFLKLQHAAFGIKGQAIFIWDLAIDGFKAAIGFAESFIERTSAVQRTMSLLATIPGSNADSEFAYLTQVANNYGLSLRAIQDDYAKLNLAAQNTSMTSEGVRRVFEQVSMATRTLHLNQQQTQLTFLAVEQMLSKGKLSMEELRKQFAERIPGAMQAFARELGVPYEALEKFITKVGMASDKVLPKLGDAIQRLYQDAIPVASRALDAEKNRIETSIAMFFQNVVRSGGTEGMTNLLKTINGLLQADHVAQVFSKAMNTITNNIAMFLATLKPEDIERFAQTALDFLATLANLAIMAGEAIKFLASNLPLVAAIGGALAGGTALLPFGPVAALVGAAVGAGAGAAGGAYLQGQSLKAPQLQERYGELQALETQLAELQQKRAAMDQSGGRASSLGELLGNMVGVVTNPFTKRGLDVQIAQKTEMANVLRAELEPLMTQAVLQQSPPTLETPSLNPLEEMETNVKKAMDKLRKLYGISGEPSKDEQAAARLALRQKNFIQDLEAKLAGEDGSDKYAPQRTNMIQMGITSGPLYQRGITALQKLQQKYDQEQMQREFEAQQSVDTEAENMRLTFGGDVRNLSKKYDLQSLKLPDMTEAEQFSMQIRKMQSELEDSVMDMADKWEKMRQKNPFFMSKEEIGEAVRQAREMGQAYIDEFKRVHEERKTFEGGARQFAREWAETSMDYGEITKNFLKGTTAEASAMLMDFVKTGKLSWERLAQYVLEYMMKVQMAKMVSPLMDKFAQFGATLIGAVMGGSGSSASLSGNAGMTAADDWMLSGMPTRAAGGAVMAGKPYLVGERGFEIFVPNHTGYVVPHESIKAGSAGASQLELEVVVNNYGDRDVTIAKGRDDRGRPRAEVTIGRMVASEMNRPGSAPHQATQNQFNTSPRLVGR